MVFESDRRCGECEMVRISQACSGCDVVALTCVEVYGLANQHETSGPEPDALHGFPEPRGGWCGHC